MKRISLLGLCIAAICMTGCHKSAQPLTGAEWGVIPNNSAEEVVSESVTGWSHEKKLTAEHFYDAEAHDGTKSLLIYSPVGARGAWTSKANLKSWSKYRFTAWIKTEEIKNAMRFGGASISLAVGSETHRSEFFTGTNDWTEIAIEFETGPDDCAEISCNFGPRSSGKAWFDDMNFELLSSESYKTEVIVDPTEQGVEMSEYIYGQFTEHLGRCIYGGIWAEMLFDRKFCDTVGSEDSPWRVMPARMATPGGRGGFPGGPGGGPGGSGAQGAPGAGGQGAPQGGPQGGQGVPGAATAEGAQGEVPAAASQGGPQGGQGGPQGGQGGPQGGPNADTASAQAGQGGTIPAGLLEGIAAGNIPDGILAMLGGAMPQFGMMKPDEMFEMDSRNAYVGEFSVRLKSREDNKVTLQQSALGVRPGISMTGYIIAKADRQMPVKVSLVAGDETKDVMVNVGTSWKRYPVEFSAFDIKDSDARFNITPEEDGTLWVGAVSLMPDDNVEGFRADVLELLKGLNSPVYRWPGGNFVSGYDWHDGIGPRDERPPRKNPAWTGIENNDVGIHEFIRLCELINAEPYIAVNAGLGTLEDAADEVEYTNGAATTPMGKLRAKNGHEEPWNVKWWSIGNEMFGDWQLGFMSTEAFAERHNEFAKAMWAVDPDIKLIGVGEIGRWDRYILAHCADYMNLVSEHFYCQDWHGGGLATHVMQIPRYIKRIADAHRSYRDSIPALFGKDIKICMDEWNYWYGPHVYGELGTRYYLRDALGIAAGLNEFLRQSDIIYMANYAQTVNVIGAIKATTTDAEYASTGMVLKMYREHFGRVPVGVDGDLRPLDVAAAIDKEHGTLTISVINPTWEQVSFPLTMPTSFELDGESHTLSKSGEIYVITGPDDMAYNTPGESPKIVPESHALKSLGKISVAPFSASIIVIPFN